MDYFNIRPLSESDIDSIVVAAGGRRAYENASAQEKPGADYLITEYIIELKSLDDEGLAKSERQIKLAKLFGDHTEKRPVIVLDRLKLPPDAQRDYDRILEGPIKSAVSKARKQLKQSRTDYPAATAAILFVVNNGYTALDHQSLVRMVAHRARNDSQEIDGVVVAGCYYYSDSFDNYFLWPIDYVPINVNRAFASYEQLKEAWNTFAEKFMTSIVLGELPPDSLKGPVIDTQFDVDRVTYVKPAPPIGEPSGFFRHGRPRNNSTGITRCPPVATTFPELTFDEWHRIRESLCDCSAYFDSYEEWQLEREMASGSGTLLKPFVPVIIHYDNWQAWCAKENVLRNPDSVFRYANELFDNVVKQTLKSARERTTISILPPRYVLAVTEEIGQDRANDLSHICMISEGLEMDPIVHEIAKDLRIFHEYAAALASAYAVLEGIEFVFWQKDLSYAWK